MSFSDIEGPYEEFKPISYLLLNAIPTTRFVKGISTSSQPYYSNHPEANISSGEFKELHNVVSFFKRQRVSGVSQFLKLLEVKKYTVNFANEQDVQAYVEAFIYDLLEGLNWLSEVRLVRQQAMANDSKADIWVVLESSGRPICVVEVKTPGPGKLTNYQVCGQIFDYMVQIRASYGQCEIFGIITTLEEWRIVWFEDSNVQAQSVTCNFPSSRPSAKELIDNFPVGASLTIPRKLIASPVLGLSSLNLSRIVASALIKGSHAYNRPLPLLSANRVYHTISKDDFQWNTPDQIANELSFEVPPSTSKFFFVLRQFHPGADGTVFLCVTNSMKLCVLKFHRNIDHCEYECNMWKLLYGIPAWIFRRTDRSRPLVLPFVFHCFETLFEDGKISVSFDFNLSHWCKEAACVQTEEDRVDFASLSEHFKRAYELTNWTVIDVATIAIAKVASKKCIHKDIEWRHVSLFPIFNESGDLRLEPVLIDLVRMETDVEEAFALETMSRRLEEICSRLK